MGSKLIVANWKENPRTEREAFKLFGDTAAIKHSQGVQMVVCPPLVFLDGIAKKFRVVRSKPGLALGAQDVFWEDQGAYTSEVGPKMLKSLGVRYVIVGHSERRKLLHETDMMVNRKIRAALASGLRVILCVGEPLPVREKGIAAAKRFIKNQLTKDLKGFGNWKLEIGNSLAVAYEPIWAIGTGRNDSPEDAAEMAHFIKKIVYVACLPSKASAKEGRLSHVSVLYGGSVNGKNALDYIHCKDIDGALVGGASLKPKEFRKIINP